MSEDSNDGGLSALVMSCAYAILAGQPTVTISSKGNPPKGFPRGELLSVGTNGASNYAVDPIKTLAWVRDRIQRVAGKAGQTQDTEK